MSTYLFIYRSQKDYAPSSDDALAEWGAFFKGIGSNVADVGNPVFDRRELGNCGDETVLGGYSMITADSLDEAVRLTKDCPALKRGGGVEVGEITPLDPGSVTATDGHAQVTSPAP
jgi:hypothetical protein